MAARLLLAVAVLAQGQDPLRTAILSKARHELDSVVLKAGIHVPADADDEAVRAAVYEFAQEEKPAHLPRFKWSGEEMPARAATPSRTRGAGESGGSSGAGGDDETMRKLRLSTTGQLKAMLTELKIEFPAGADKEVSAAASSHHAALTSAGRAMLLLVGSRLAFFLKIAMPAFLCTPPAMPPSPPPPAPLCLHTHSHKHTFPPTCLFALLTCPAALPFPRHSDRLRLSAAPLPSSRRCTPRTLDAVHGRPTGRGWTKWPA